MRPSAARGRRLLQSDAELAKARALPAANRADGDAPGWRREIRTLSEAGRMAKRNGPVRSAASQLIPACAVARPSPLPGTPRSRLAPGDAAGAPGASSTTTPSWPVFSAGRVPRSYRGDPPHRGYSKRALPRRLPVLAPGIVGEQQRQRLAPQAPAPAARFPQGHAPWRRDSPAAGPHPRRCRATRCSFTAGR